MLRANFNNHKKVFFNDNSSNSARHFYRWLIIMFNGVDNRRVEKVGPDRACAEWLLRNGASVRWKGSSKFLKNYNLLPKEEEKFYLVAVDATDSAIHHIGFPHFHGCKYIEDIKLVRCSYIENEALSLLSIIKESLKSLEVVECKNITDEGLHHLLDLKHLTTLRLGGFPYVKKKDEVIKMLSSLPNCTITYD